VRLLKKIETLSVFLVFEKSIREGLEKCHILIKTAFDLFYHKYGISLCHTCGKHKKY